MNPEVLGVLIPIVAIVFGTSIALLNVLLDYKKKRSIFELHHRERLASIEKGMDVPPLPPELFQSQRERRVTTPGDILRRGLVWTFLGCAVIGAMTLENQQGAYYGLIPLAIGVANLVYYAVHARASNAPDGPTGSI
jgi:hypothetical protein